MRGLVLPFSRGRRLVYAAAQRPVEEASGAEQDNIKFDIEWTTLADTTGFKNAFAR